MFKKNYLSKIFGHLSEDAYGRSFFEDAHGRSWTFGGQYMDVGWTLSRHSRTLEKNGHATITVTLPNQKKDCLKIIKTNISHSIMFFLNKLYPFFLKAF